MDFSREMWQAGWSYKRLQEGVEAEQKGSPTTLQISGADAGGPEEEGRKVQAGRKPFHSPFICAKTPISSHLRIPCRWDGISHRSTGSALRSSGLGRCGGTLPWSGEERNRDRRTGSPWGVGPDRPCSSCHTSHTVQWNCLRNT